MITNSKNSNNNIILIIIIFFILFVIFINFDKNENDSNTKCNLCNEKLKNNETFKNNETIKKNKTVNFKNRDNIKYFDNKESPSNIIMNKVEVEDKNMIEEFNYDNIESYGDFEKLNINRDSTKLVSFMEVKDTDSISEKFNKLLGTVENDITEENIRLISGTESINDPLKYKSTYIYNNSYKTDLLINNDKYKPFSGKNGYRSI